MKASHTTGPIHLSCDTPPHSLDTVVLAPEDVEHAVRRRRETNEAARGGAGACSEGVDPLEAEEAQKQDDDQQPDIVILYNSMFDLPFLQTRRRTGLL